jgi:hypothetical protein
MRAALQALDSGAAGGGAWVKFGEPVDLLARVALVVFSAFYFRLLRWAAGCFIFARRSAFEAVGGFDDHLYVSEEITLTRALKRVGRVAIVQPPVMTSPRKLRLRSIWEIVPFGIRFLRHGFAMVRTREGLDWWYDGKR